MKQAIFHCHARNTRRLNSNIFSFNGNEAIQKWSEIITLSLHFAFYKRTNEVHIKYSCKINIDIKSYLYAPEGVYSAIMTCLL